MEVKRRKMRDLRQALKVQELVEMLVNMLDYPMHAVDIHIAAFERAHRFTSAGRYGSALWQTASTLWPSGPITKAPK